MRALLEEILWFTEYPEEIETDFAAIYGILDLEALSGRKFVRFARRLVYYDGAVVKKMQIDYSERTGEGQDPYKAVHNEGPTTKVSMADAMKKYQGDDFDSLNHESQANGMGDLFERVTVPSS